MMLVNHTCAAPMSSEPPFCVCPPLTSSSTRSTSATMLASAMSRISPIDTQRRTFVSRVIRRGFPTSSGTSSASSSSGTRNRGPSTTSALGRAAYSTIATTMAAAAG
jgi:hypothetical protein